MPSGQLSTESAWLIEFVMVAFKYCEQTFSSLSIETTHVLFSYCAGCVTTVFGVQIVESASCALSPRPRITLNMGSSIVTWSP
ncbi:hypothetical protein B1M_08217 [Burkholderia sp. TJI49]|nr:hypothetical protein B1M_08217 [Burkholderia sp. TJI49]